MFTRVAPKKEGRKGEEEIRHSGICISQFGEERHRFGAPKMRGGAHQPHRGDAGRGAFERQCNGKERGLKEVKCEVESTIVITYTFNV